MPSSDGSVCAEKIPVPMPLDMRPSTSAQALKRNAQELTPTQLTQSTTINVSTVEPPIPLLPLQGQKWTQLFDFDKMLQQLRIAEYNLYQNRCGTGRIVEGSMNVKKCNQQLRQVQSLEGCDMHYYGIAPKQKALHAVVCNSCAGIYTAVGFNNHMMLKHPEIWNNTSTEIGDIQDMLGNGQKFAAKPVSDIIKPHMPPPPPPPPRSSKSTLMPAPLFPPNPRHKSKSSSSSGGRARSKNRHQSAAAAAAAAAATATASVANAQLQLQVATNEGTAQRQTSSSSKSSRKSSAAATTSLSKDNSSSSAVRSKSSGTASALPELKSVSVSTSKMQSTAKELKDKSNSEKVSTASSSKRKVS